MTPRPRCGRRSRSSTAPTEPDTLTEIGQLDAFYDEHGFTGRRDGDAAELEALRALRPVLRELLTAERDDAAELVNALLADAQAMPQLRRHDGLDWHIHAVPERRPARAPRRGRGGDGDGRRDPRRRALAARRCAPIERCDGLVLDLSRNRSRRYCSTTCANRNAVAAYRARRRD